MLYALLAAISAPSVPIITPTPTLAATPIVTAVTTPIPTPILTPIATHIPIDITMIPSWTEYITLGIAIISLIATIILGRQAYKTSKAANELAKAANEQNEIAIKLSNSANSLAQTAIEQSERTAQHEKNMRDIELKVSLLNSITELYSFFHSEVSPVYFYNIDSFSSEKAAKIHEIQFKAKFVFSETKYMEIKREIDRINLCFLKHTLPQKKDMPDTLIVPFEELEKYYCYWGYSALTKDEQKDVIFTFVASIREHLEPIFKGQMLEL